MKINIIEQDIHRGKVKLHEMKNNQISFRWNISLSTNLLFLKIVGQYVTVIGRLASTGWHFNSVGSTIPTLFKKICTTQHNSKI